jgi:alanine-synthesizing transaminase
VFSSRVPANLGPNRLTQALAEFRQSGRPVVDLTESNPTRAGFDYPPDLLSSLADPRGLRYQPEPFGLLEAREAVAGQYAARGLQVPPDHMVLTASTSEGYSLLFKLLTNPGDEVLIPRPSYPLFELLTELDAVVPRAYSLEYHGAWGIDFGSLERMIGARTRAVLLVSPNNPTGSFVSPGDWERLADLCAPREIPVVVDEVFADYMLEPAAVARPPAVLAREDLLVFALGGLSKAVGLPQLKLGWIAVTGPPSRVKDALERLELICDSYLSVSTPVQLAASELLARGAGVRRQISARVVANYASLKRLAAQAPSCRVLRADAGWYGVVQVPTFRSEEDLVLELLTRDGVLAHPGYFFDFSSESYIVVSLLVHEATFSDAVRRMLMRASSAPGARLSP